MNGDLEAWVAARLTCGLGNRLFQLAAAHGRSIEWNVPLVFAMPYCLPAEHGDFESIFKLFPTIPKIWKAEPLIGITQDKCFEFKPLPVTAPAGRTLLHGMWQAAEYISDSFKPSWESINDREVLLTRWNLESVIQRQNTAFLHVRLGDYKILPHHQVNLLPYFVKAMEQFPSSTRFLVFSDEPSLAKTFPIFGDRCVFVEEPCELRSLFLMASCSAGAITANSTFSWWGAFFGRQQSRDYETIYKAFMPAQWMVSSESTDAIYPAWVTRI